MPSSQTKSAPVEVDSLTGDPSTWHGSSLLSVTQLSKSGLSLLLETAQEMRRLVQSKGGDLRLQHRLLATVFYEASTRTSCSFQAAFKRLGGDVIHVDAGGSTSSTKKGESLSDTLRCLECYVDVTVLRHPIKGSVGEVIQNCCKPVLNAGDGIGEHPTQALLDFFTICDELEYDINSCNDTLSVVLLGDLKYGRTVHSLAKLLARSGIPVNLCYCAPKSLEMPQYVQEYVSQYPTVTQVSFESLEEATRNANILYVTRVQKERFETEEAYLSMKGSYVVDATFMETAAVNEKFRVLHPLPRVDEIATTVDSDPRAAYFRQMENGMYVRMALLALVMGVV